ncbi:MAG: sodium:solute symporter family protein, partial [Calditrichaeota bacterium]|nr:sodium:solute symporter family protein [Calditrichota bacterium]
MTLHPLEILPIALYLGILLLLGLRKNGDDGSAESFVLGGRGLTLTAFIATLVTTWYGGILAVGEYTFLYGMSTWIVFGLPYYLFAVIFAWLLAPRIQADPGLSIPDYFYRHYGKKAGILSAMFTFMMTLPAPYLLMTAMLISLFSGWPMWMCLLAATFVSLLYVHTGGFRSVVRTDLLQFVLMFGGFVLLLVVLIGRYGGLSFLAAHLPEMHLTWHGGNPPEMILIWFFIALWTFVDPGFQQRCAAAASPRTARKGIVLSVSFWFFFDMMTTATGLYARAIFGEGGIEPLNAFPALGHQELPPFFSGLFLTALLAVIMSTTDSFLLISGTTIGHDLMSSGWGSARQTRTLVRRGLLISSAFSVILALLVPSVVNLWLVLGNIFIPPMLLPMLGCFFPRLNPGPGRVLGSMVASATVTFLFLGIALYRS